MLDTIAPTPEPSRNAHPFDWELDEVKRAALRQQRETTPYPSQMNGLRDDFKADAPASTPPSSTEQTQND